MKPADQTDALALEPGLHFGISAAQYHADPVKPLSLSSSIAWTLVNKSPLHAWSEHPKLGNAAKAPSDEMDFGSVCHELFLGSGGGFSVWTGDSWRGNAAKDFWDAAVAEGKTPIRKPDLDRAGMAVAAWKAQLEAMGLSYVWNDPDGVSESVAVWQDGDVSCRAMLDRWLPGRGEIVDLKTMSESAHPRACAARIASMGYDMRSEFYKRGIIATSNEETKQRLWGRLKFLFIFAETKPPFAVTPARINGEWSTIAQSRCGRAIASWCECLKSGIWPAYATDVQTIEAPAWALAQEIAAS